MGGTIKQRNWGVNYQRKSHYPYLRIRDVFSDDVPKLCIDVHQLHFAQIKNIFK